MVDYYGTLGPACREKEKLEGMLDAGMTGIRINLSHGGLSYAKESLDLLRAAARARRIDLKILIDLEGPELRIGALRAPVVLHEDDLVSAVTLNLPGSVTEHISYGDVLLLDDGKIRLEVLNGAGDCMFRVLTGGMLTSKKSVAIQNKTVDLPTLTKNDYNNLKEAGEYGVTGVMLPFARGIRDLKNLKNALFDAGLRYVKIFSKIENMSGVTNLDELIEGSDEIVIARGDLGNSMDLWKLPGTVERIGRKCRMMDMPYMVVTQMLDSMCRQAVPTRAEVTDVYRAVLDGASSVMLTGETAAGSFPVEAMTYLVKIGKEAEHDRRN
ncbi:MAG: pyruvate kinase [Lachnospiraceae bacterium]|nr:pyruvate kinase [Lachnospiraceae bacterium]